MSDHAPAVARHVRHPCHAAICKDDLREPVNRLEARGQVAQEESIRRHSPLALRLAYDQLRIEGVPMLEPEAFARAAL